MSKGRNTGRSIRSSAKTNDSTQGVIPVKQISQGVIQTVDNRYISMLKVFPVNFYEKSKDEQERICSTFGRVFRNNCAKYKIKVLSDAPSPSELIATVEKNRKRFTNNPTITKIIEDYENHITELCEDASVTKTYLFIYEYDGDEKGKKAETFNEIASQMDELKNYFISVFTLCGCLCAEPEDDNYDLFLTDIQYKYFNRNTAEYQPLNVRISRLKKDKEIYETLTGKKGVISIQDIIAPKGIHFTNRNYWMMDGMYYSCLVIKEYNPFVAGGWLDVFNYGTCVDIDVIIKRLNKSVTKMYLDNFNGQTNIAYQKAVGNEKLKKAGKLARRFENNSRIQQALNQGQDLWDVCTVLTIRADSVDNLARMQRAIKKDASDKGIVMETSFLWNEAYFELVMPLTNINSVFSSYRHNMLTENLEYLFCFTTYTLCSPKGFLLGVNRENFSLVSIDNFDTRLYSNANMVLLGTSGAGKTFTEQLIARHMLLVGSRCYIMCPVKGVEYKQGCEAVGGAYILLTQGSKDCINLLDLSEDDSIDESVVDITSPVVVNPVAKKISVIITWIQLLMGNTAMTLAEANTLELVITKMYKEFGFTTDNNSIRDEKGNIKPMPILSDLLRFVKEEPLLNNIAILLKSFIEGAGSNMNGQTNIDRSNRYIVFDIDSDVIRKEYVPAFMYIAFDMIYTMVKSDNKQKDLVILDETWKMMTNEQSAEQVFSMTKLIRGYGGGTVIATQELQDFIHSSCGRGISILNNSDITIFLHMKKNEVKLINDYRNISENDVEYITTPPKKGEKGKALVIAGEDKIPINIKASEMELRAFNTDVNLRQKWAEEEKAQTN